MGSPTYHTCLLPLFDTQILPSTIDSDFPFLQPEFIASTNSLIRTINNGNSNEWIYSEDERAYFSEEPHILRDMHAALCFNTVRKQKLNLRWQQLKKQIEEKKAWRQWSMTQYAFISNLLQQNHRRHAILKAQWELHSRCALYSHTAIVQIAKTHLRNLIQYFKDIQKELDDKYYWKKPPAYINAYWQYLVEFQQYAKTLQDTLSESMLARLIALDESRFRESNLVATMTQKLREKEDGSLSAGNSDSPKRTLTSSPDQLSSDDFTYFHRYIQEHGSAVAKERLLQLSWFKQQDNNAIVPVAEIPNILLVPIELVGLVPSKRLWPNWLFRGNNVRYDLFEKSMYLLAYLNKQRSIENCFVDIELPESYDYLLEEFRRKETEIDNMLNMIEQYQAQFSSFLASLLYHDTKKCLSNYRTILATYQRTIFEDKLCLFENLIGGYFDKSTNAATIQPKPPAMSCEQLQMHWEDLQKKYGQCINSTFQRDNRAMQDRMQMLQQKIAALAAFNKAQVLFVKLAEGELITACEVLFLIDYSKRLTARNSPLVSAFERFCAPTVALLSQQLLQEFKNNPVAENDREQCIMHRDQVLCLHAVVKHFGTESMQLEIEKNFNKYLLRYLQGLLLEANHPSDSVIALEHQCYTAETLFHLGQSYRCGNKTIKELLEELHELKTKNHTVWKARCTSIVIIIAVEFSRNRFNKELSDCEQHLFDTLKNDPAYHNDNTVKLLKEICENLANNGSSQEIAYTQLSKVEQVLMGNNPITHAATFDLIATVARARKAQSMINDQARDPVTTLQQIKTVGQSMTQLLQQHPLTRSREYSQLVPSGRRARFSKQYIREEIIQAVDRSMTVPL